MISSLSLSRLRRAQLWWDECPVSEASSGGTLRTTVAAAAAGPAASSTRTAIEVVVPKGPVTMYGLLGGEHRPAPGSTLEVRVLHTGADVGDGPPFASRLAVAPETPLTGLPAPLAQAVLSAVEDAVASAGLASGVLTIDCAAHGRIGSNPHLFRSLTRALVTLLARRPGTEEEAAAIVEPLLP